MAISETHDLGNTYVHTLHVPRGGPVLELGTTHEVEEPWRVGRCVVFRVWKGALVVGRWGPGRTYEELLAAEAPEHAAGVSFEQIREDFIPEATMSGNIVSHGWVVR